MSKEYKKEITSLYSPIGKEERQVLFERLKMGDVAAKDKIFNSCLPLVVQIANHFYPNNKHVDLDDFIQEGNIALLKAIEHWDISKGWITTVATRVICNAFNDLIATANYKMKRPYRIPKSTMDKAKKRGIVLDSSKRVGEKVCFKIEDSIDNNIENPCVADIISMLSNINEHDRNIFLFWLENINKNNRCFLTAQHFKISMKEVKECIKNTKRVLKSLGKKEKIAC